MSEEFKNEDPLQNIEAGQKNLPPEQPVEVKKEKTEEDYLKEKAEWQERMKELKEKSNEELDKLSEEIIQRGNVSITGILTESREAARLRNYNFSVVELVGSANEENDCDKINAFLYAGDIVQRLTQKFQDQGRYYDIYFASPLKVPYKTSHLGLHTDKKDTENLIFPVWSGRNNPAVTQVDLKQFGKPVMLGYKGTVDEATGRGGTNELYAILPKEVAEKAIILGQADINNIERLRHKILYKTAQEKKSSLKYFQVGNCRQSTVINEIQISEKGKKAVEQEFVATLEIPEHRKKRPNVDLDQIDSALRQELIIQGSPEEKEAGLTKALEQAVSQSNIIQCEILIRWGRQNNIVIDRGTYLEVEEELFRLENEIIEGKTELFKKFNIISNGGTIIRLRRQAEKFVQSAKKRLAENDPESVGIFFKIIFFARDNNIPFDFDSLTDTILARFEKDKSNNNLSLWQDNLDLFKGTSVYEKVKDTIFLEH